MNKREALDNLRRENARERGEIRENEMYTREAEDYHIEEIRDKMTRILADPDIDAEKRKKRLASLKEEIETILDEREEREHAFIEEELRRHQAEQELEEEILREERAKKAEVPDEQTENLRKLLRAHPTLTAGAEQKRKEIEKNRIDLSEEEQFSTILINNSAIDKIPQFKTTRRRKKDAPTEMPRIDTIVLKQREIGMLYRESQELQEAQLKKAGKKPPEPPEETEEHDELNEPIGDKDISDKG